MTGTGVAPFSRESRPPPLPRLTFEDFFLRETLLLAGLLALGTTSAKLPSLYATRGTKAMLGSLCVGSKLRRGRLDYDVTPGPNRDVALT
jgi:hypothetical protein